MVTVVKRRSSPNLTCYEVVQVAELMAASLARDVSHLEQSRHRSWGRLPSGAPALLPTPTTFLGRFDSCPP